MAQSETKTRIKPLESVQEPPLYRVVYLNDNQTTYEFVVETLIEYFDYTTETAEQITVDIHEAGTIKNSEIATELALPPVKIHCSILAEDAIKAAVNDYRNRHST